MVESIPVKNYPSFVSELTLFLVNRLINEVIQYYVYKFIESEGFFANKRILLVLYRLMVERMLLFRKG